jgi:hypothetical protein
MDDRQDESRQRRDDAREIDRMALEGGKSEWQERSAPAAGDPVSDEEKKGLNILAQSDPRGDGALEGVSARKAGDVPDTPPIDGTSGDGRRRNPPLVEDAGTGDGGISASGGVAGGA